MEVPKCLLALMEMTLAEAVLADTLLHTQIAKYSKQVHSKRQALINRLIIETVFHATRCDIPVAQIYHHQDQSEAFEVTWGYVYRTCEVTKVGAFPGDWAHQQQLQCLL
jgi:hypothetical protein